MRPFGKLEKPLGDKKRKKRKYKWRDPEIRREEFLQARYGISINDYEAMLARQNGVCWICHRPPKKKRLNVDHCHKTGKIRGLLCFTCNWGLSWFKNNATFLERAGAYLRRIDDSDVELPELPVCSWIHFEWANNRWGDFNHHFEIARKNAGKEKIPVVLEKHKDHPEWVAILDLKDFLKIVRSSKFYVKGQLQRKT